MTATTDHTPSPIASLARRTGFSPDAVTAMQRAVVGGGGGMAQFDHPEFGGAGQWMRGGLLMTADPSDDALRTRIGQLCEALGEAAPDHAPTPRAAQSPGPSAAPAASPQSQSLPAQVQRQTSGASPAFAAGGSWWPASLGAPSTSGSQDGLRYAWFGERRRLVIDDGGRVTVYDTGDHRIGGVSQSQGGGRALAFTSQHGPVAVERLPVVDDDGRAGRPDDVVPRPAPAASAGDRPHAPSAAGAADPFDALERLAALHARGIVDDAEYRAKKAELLARI